jgi:hypothetical protein
MRIRAILAATAVLCVCAAPASAVGVRRIASEAVVSKLAAFGGIVAWSHYGATIGEYRLMAYVHGRASTLPVAPRRVPFDVSLGPDGKGKAVAVYSRCATESPVWVDGVSSVVESPPSGCRLYEYSFATRREVRLGRVSAYLPTIWGNELAYVRARAGQPTLFAQPVTAPKRGRLRAVALPGGDASRTGPGPVSLDLRGANLAVAWQGGDGTGGWTSTIYLDTLTGSQLALDTETTDSRSPGFLDWPFATASGDVDYGRFDGSFITPAPNVFDRIGLTGASPGSSNAVTYLRGEAVDGTVTYAMSGPYAGAFGNCLPAGCTIEMLRGVSYR